MEGEEERKGEEEGEVEERGRRRRGRKREWGRERKVERLPFRLHPLAQALLLSSTTRPPGYVRQTNMWR